MEARLLADSRQAEASPVQLLNADPLSQWQSWHAAPINTKRHRTTNYALYNILYTLYLRAILFTPCYSALHRAVRKHSTANRAHLRCTPADRLAGAKNLQAPLT